jgi:hypothetical protein
VSKDITQPLMQVCLLRVLASASEEARVKGKRFDIKALLRDPVKRRELMVRTIIATQAREGIKTSRAQAEAAYDKVQGENRAKNLRLGK